MTTDEATRNFDKLEFWALTILFVLCLPIYMEGDYIMTVGYVTSFAALLYFNFRLAPQIISGERLVKNKGTTAQWMAQATDAAIPKASQLMRMFIKDSKNTYLQLCCKFYFQRTMPLSRSYLCALF